MVRQYRADIDGLRALAVGGVVLFHAFPKLLTGGFIGVDVFFVLSGFLITAIIRSEAEANHFSITAFYERRFRRIVPALAVMVVATTIAAVAILPPSELRSYGRSLIGVAVFASNLIFWRDSGYFDTASADKPLLHTWSLAVEEQFYILWPLIAVALVRLGRRRSLVAFVWSTVALSLLAAVWAVKVVPSSAFYLLPYRAWELGFGALLAVGAVPALRAPALREGAAVLGLALIVVPMMLYTEQTPFPGLAAVPPCLGTLLLIHAGQGYDTRVGQLLSLRPILFVGLTSYSFYLWHWPLLVLPRIALARELHAWEAALAIAVAFALASWSLRYVERPFRGKGGLSLSRGQVLSASVACFVVLGALGVGLVATNGLFRFASPGVRSAENAVLSVNPMRAKCHDDDNSGILAPIASCIDGAAGPAGRYQVLVWGDSHADHLVPGLVAAGKRDGFRVRQGTVSGCPTTALLSDDPRYRACRRYHEAVLAEAARQPDLAAIVLSGRWQKATTSFEARGASLAAFTKSYRDVMQRTIAKIRERVGPRVPIVLVANTPEFDFWPALCVARRAKLGRDTAPCMTGVSRDTAQIHATDQVLQSLASANVRVVDLYGRFCRGTVCRTGADGKVYFRDDDHLSNAGSAVAAEAILPYLRRM